MQIINTTANETTTAPFRVDPSRGGHNGEVSMQWMARPADQRFLSLDELHDYKQKFYRGTFQTRAKSSEFEFVTPEINTVDDLHKLTVGVKIDNGSTIDAREVAPTHWAFGQLAGLAKFPAAPLRELPSPLVGDILSWRLKHAREIEEIKLYGGADELYAATGPDYGRIPDFEVVQAVRAVAGSGRGEMRWKIPGVLNWQTNMYDPNAPVTKDSTTLYASDRDVFMFLVDDRNPIEVGKLADGSPDLMFRGFYIQNSEVGSRSLKLAAFYLRAVCMNRNLWGVECFEDIKINHTRLAPDRWLHQAQPALRAYADGSQKKLIEGVAKAKEAKVATDHDKAVEFLMGRKFSQARVKAILEVGEKEEGHPPRSAWDMAQAITADARSRLNTDDRLAQEQVAKSILDKVA
jgi:hypothetical protein